MSSNPLRKDLEELTTADIAGNRPQQVEEGRPRLVKDEREERTVQERDQVRDSETTGVMADRGAPMQGTTPLFPNNELQQLRTQWDNIQTGFVDEPRRAVEQADGLVASAMRRLAEVYAEERSRLEQQWDRGDNVSTEDLRVALQRYRSFFHRLLSN